MHHVCVCVSFCIQVNLLSPLSFIADPPNPSIPLPITMTCWQLCEACHLNLFLPCIDPPNTSMSCVWPVQHGNVSASLLACIDFLPQAVQIFTCRQGQFYSRSTGRFKWWGKKWKLVTGGSFQVWSCLSLVSGPSGSSSSQSTNSVSPGEHADGLNNAAFKRQVFTPVFGRTHFLRHDNALSCTTFQDQRSQLHTDVVALGQTRGHCGVLFCW